MIDSNNIKIILCRTWDAGNIGSVLRAMKNFDFNNVVAFNQINFDDEKMLKMAAGAKSHLQYLRKSNDLRKEVNDSQVVYAFTARKRKYLKVLTPEQMAQEVFALPKGAKVSLLFGNETNGLDNEEVDLADRLVMIPTSESYSSLNLASAVLVALYELSKNKVKAKSSNNNEILKVKNAFPQEAIIDVQEKEALYSVVSKIICDTILKKKIHEKQFKENIKYLFKRMFLTKKEVKFIKSIFKLIEKRLK